jgi:SNF2 family DNA or RNA helicase
VAKDFFNQDEQCKMLKTSLAASSTMTTTSMTTTAMTTTTMIPSSTVSAYTTIKPIIKLWDYQEDTLKFIERREKDEDGIKCRGGMCCHDMGLGKTPIMLAHILADNQAMARLTGERFNGPTAILCNTILTPTWKAEIEKSFPQYTFVYYDLTDMRQLDHLLQVHIEKCCDIVFITYSMLLTTYLILTMPQKSEEAIIEEVAKEYSEEHGIEEEEDETEEVTTTTTMSKTSLNNMLKRQKTIEKHEKLKMLFKIKWRRVVTDESQQFVNKKTKLFQAVKSLKADSKWIVTGTPIQNSLDNIYACFEFIGVNYDDDNNLDEKSNNAKIKDILSKVMIRLVKSDSLLKKNNVLTCKGINRQIIFIDFETNSEKLVYLLYASYGLHNLQKMREGKKKGKKKQQHGGGKDYHNKVTYIIQLMRQLSISFRIVKNLILPKGMLTMNMATQLMLKDTGFNETIFDDDSDDSHSSMVEEGSGDDESHYCNDLCEFSSSMNRHTIFQYKSILSSSESESLSWNPFEPSKEFDICDNGDDRRLYRLIYEEMKNGVSDDRSLFENLEDKVDFIITRRKCLAMMEHIRNRTLTHASTKDIHIINYIKNIQDPTDKVIIFSDYVKALECLAVEFNKEGQGFKYAIVTGNMNSKSIAKQLDIFKTDPTVKILLLSLKLGNNGLNLNCANHIIFYNKWWNPHIEQQAQDRIIRIGQSKMVYIRYFIIRGTIEEYILSLSDNKKKISADFIKPVEEEAAVDDETEDRSQLKEFKDLVQLFNFDIKVLRPSLRT